MPASATLRPDPGPIRLYQLPFSHHCAKVRVVLLEKRLAHELPAIPGGSTRSPEFLAVTALGKVPFLLHGDVALGESEVIIEYLEDIAPTPPMLPRGPAARARSRWLTRLHDLYFGKQLSVLFMALLDGRQRAPEMAAEVAEMARLTDLVEASIEPAPFFFGETFGAADATYALSVHYLKLLMRAYEQPSPDERAPKLLRWFDEACRRPSVAQVIAECEAALNTP